MGVCIVKKERALLYIRKGDMEGKTKVSKPQKFKVCSLEIYTEAVKANKVGEIQLLEKKMQNAKDNESLSDSEHLSR
jgi:hypothetical protein